MPKKASRSQDIEDYGEGWEKYVPIMASDDNREIDIFLHDLIQAPCNYSEAVDTIRRGKKGDVITLHINNGGGVVDSAFMIYDACIRSEAKIIAELSGIVASAETIITMACDEIRVALFTQFMIHNYSGGAHGKGHEIKAYVKFSDLELNRAFRKIYEGFLTEKEMTEVIEGQDIWLNEDEIYARWARKQGDNSAVIQDYKTKTDREDKPKRAYTRKPKGE